MDQLLLQVVEYILNSVINYHEVGKIASNVRGEGHSDTKGTIAALHFVLTNGAKYDVDDRTLLLEIQQLGLQKENADAIARIFSEQKDAMRTRFDQQSYSMNKLKQVDWRVDNVLASSRSNDDVSQTSLSPSSPSCMSPAEVHLKFTIDTDPHLETSPGVSTAKASGEVACAMTKEKFRVLHHELRQARAQMAVLEG